MPLPRSPPCPCRDDAALVDLGIAQRVLSGPFVNDTTEVWLSHECPSGHLLPAGSQRCLGGRYGQCRGASSGISPQLGQSRLHLVLDCRTRRRGARDRNNRLRAGRGRPATQCGAGRHAGYRHPRGVSPSLERSRASAGARHRATLRRRRRSRGSSSRPEVCSGVRRLGAGTTPRNSTSICTAGGSAALDGSAALAGRATRSSMLIREATIEKIGSAQS